MVLPSVLFCLLLPVIKVSGHLLPDPEDGTARMPRKGDPEEGRKAPLRNQDRQDRSIRSQGNHNCQEGNPLCQSTILKVLDFSADNDQEPDSNGEYTSATLDAGPLPESFTICLAIMVDAWTTELSSARLFALLDVDFFIWGSISLYSV